MQQIHTTSQNKKMPNERHLLICNNILVRLVDYRWNQIYASMILMYKKLEKLIAYPDISKRLKPRGKPGACVRRREHRGVKVFTQLEEKLLVGRRFWRCLIRSILTTRLSGIGELHYIRLKKLKYERIETLYYLCGYVDRIRY